MSVPASVPAARPLTQVEQACIQTLLYAHIFRYPLTLEEVKTRVGIENNEEVPHALKGLCDREFIYSVGGFYSMTEDFTLASRRRAGNDLAVKKMKQARKVASLIHRFPFVRSVMISGSLSKDYMDEKSDLDFFLITKPGRLWLVKFAMVFIKRIILFGSYRFFCVNYLIDENHLEIEEKNRFTATELITVRPVTNAALYHRFLQENQWIKQVYPHAKPQDSARENEPKLSFKALLEWLLGGRLGAYIDRKALELFQKRTDRIYRKQYAEKDYVVAFKSKEHVSKYHEKNFQRRVMERYEELQREFEADYGVELFTAWQI